MGRRTTAVVVGGGGWLGSFLTFQLESMRDVEVVALDVKRPPPDHRGILPVWRKVDILDLEGVREAFSVIKPAIVFHVAAVIDLRSVPDPHAARVNIEGTRNLLVVANACPACRTLVYCSTIDCVSSTFGIERADENTPYPKTFSNIYKKSKASAEKLVLEFDGPNLRTASVRPGHLFGPGDPIATTVTSFPVCVGTRSRHRMSFTYVENAARAHIDCAKYLERKTRNFNVFFATDFDVNFFEAYYDIASKAIPSLWIPTWVFSIVLFLIDAVSRVVFRCIDPRRNVIHPYKGLNTASIESGSVLTASNLRARSALGYLAPPRYVNRKGAIERAREAYGKPAFALEPLLCPRSWDGP